MSEVWTIRRIVKWITDDLAPRGIGSPRLDAELIVAEALGVDRVKLYLDLERPLSPTELATIRGLVARRRKREPMAYLRGRREFYGREMIVSPAVLVPRPETETLVELALAAMPADRELRVLDLCTGSGCIGVTLLAERPLARAVLTDLSAEALEIARRNADKHVVAERARFALGDLFAALEAAEPAFDVITANPPYIAESERAALEPDVRDFEPGLALFAPDQGLAVVRRIARDAARGLVPGGVLFVEIGMTQGAATAEIFRAAGLVDVRVHADLGGRDRVVEGRRAPS
ncbi:MAG: peptide chain release factor N(5)-glutamine methyltransferase [Sandaracinus sp.]